MLSVAMRGVTAAFEAASLNAAAEPLAFTAKVLA